MAEQDWTLSEELRCPACGSHRIAVAVDETCRCLACGESGLLDDFDPEQTQPFVLTPQNAVFPGKPISEVNPAAVWGTRLDEDYRRDVRGSNSL